MEAIAQRLRQRPRSDAAVRDATAARCALDAAPGATDASCRICLDGPGRQGFIAPCLCSGSMMWVHQSCLRRWQLVTLRDSNNDYTRCETCKGPYNIPGPPVGLRVRLRRAVAAIGWTAFIFCRSIGRCHVPLVALMLASTTLSIATAELMEGAPSVGWWLGGSAWRILALAVILALVSVGTALVFTSLDGAVLNDRVQRRLLKNVFIQNALVVISLVLYSGRNWVPGAGLLEKFHGVNTTIADADRVSGGPTFRQEAGACLITLLRSWNLIGPVLPLFLLVAHELRRPLLAGEQGRGVIARQVRAIVLAISLSVLSVLCLLPMVDIVQSQLDLLMDITAYQHSRSHHPGPVWTWPPDPLVNVSAETLSFAASAGGYRRRGHSPEALSAALDHFYEHERQRRRAAAAALNMWHHRFPPTSPQSYAPLPGEPWTWTMLPQNYTDPSVASDSGTQNYSASPLSQVWRPQQSFLVEPVEEGNDVEARQPLEHQNSPPASFLVSGSGCSSCNGEYVVDGEHDGVAQYSYGEGENKVVLLRYAMPTGTRYWYLSLASDLHSGKGDIYRAKSACKRRGCVDLPPEAGWTDTCALHGQKCTEKWIDFHRWRVGGPPFPAVQALGGEGSRYANQRAQQKHKAAPFQLIMHGAKDGDTVLVSPGVHTAGVSLTEHLAIRGACAVGAANAKSCEPGHPPPVLVGTGCTGVAGMLRWWIRRTVFPKLLSIGELLGVLGYGTQECAAVWVTSPAAILADLTIASTKAAWEATAWTAGQESWNANPTEPINLARPTVGPFHPVALEVSMGSAAVVAHCVIIGGVVVRGPTTSPLLEFLTVKHATTGVLISNHASPTVRDVRFKHVETGIEATRWAMPVLTRVHVVSAKQIGVHFTTESSGALSMSAVVASGTCNLAVTSGASPVVSDSLFRLAAQCGALFDEGGKGTMRRCHIVESHYAGLEIRGSETDPDIGHSSVHGGAAVGLYVHSNGAGTLNDVTIMDNRNGAAEFSEGGRSRLLRCHLGGRSINAAAVLEVHGVYSSPEFVDCIIDATAVKESVAVKVSDAARPVLRGVDVQGADVGVLALGAVALRLVGCTVHGNSVGVQLVGRGGSSVLDGSSIHGDRRSIVGVDGGYARVRNCDLRALGLAGLGTEFAGGAGITVE